MQKFTVSRDDSIYEAFPDVALTRAGHLICVFAECTHHADRSYTRIMLTDSADRGRTWSVKRPLTPPSHGMPYWNCPRITALRDGRLAVLVDRMTEEPERRAENLLFFSDDEGRSWSDPVKTPADGIVPDRLLELEDGNWLVSTHKRNPESRCLEQSVWSSRDRGASWSGPVSVARLPGLNLCEASILCVEGLTLAAFLRENSGMGYDAYKTLSFDGGTTWTEPVPFPVPACHRPVAGRLRDGQILITCRFMQGGKGWTGWWTQNLFAVLTDRDSVLAESRNEAHTRILPVDFDRSPESDTGYSGWVQFENGEIYIVNYIMDEAPKAQIRGYALTMEDFLLTKPEHTPRKGYT